MRLINVTTHKLEAHIDPPPYAILSHTWREGEVLFTDFAADDYKFKAGYRKIIFLLSQAQKENIEYVWIDTVCIDKSSSAELSEAINSMFAWYQQAEVCYVYLDDVDSVLDIRHSRWITRAWTLQELIAPAKVCFFTCGCDYLGTRDTLISELVTYTGIDQIVLKDPQYVKAISVAGRMSWASKREATRIEDIAYSLLGIFDVNMPLLYGEGSKAFQRLQYEIMGQLQDISLLAFDRSQFPPFGKKSLLATHPSYFNKPSKIIGVRDESNCKLTASGLKADLQVFTEVDSTVWVNLDCRFEFDQQRLIALRVWQVTTYKNRPYYVLMATDIRTIARTKWSKVPRQAIMLAPKPPQALGKDYNNLLRYVCSIQAESLISHGFSVIYAGLENGIGSWNSTLMASEVLTESRVVVRKIAFVHEEHNEAFIIGLVDTRKWSLSKKLLLSVKTKPERAECERWLTDEGMYTTMTPLTPSESAEFIDGISEGTVTFDDTVWTTVHDWMGQPPRQLQDIVQLSSRECLRSISIYVNILQDRPGYAVIVSHGDQAALR